MLLSRTELALLVFPLLSGRSLRPDPAVVWECCDPDFDFTQYYLPAPIWN
ncbi:hypothetical protein [Hymenobacter latericus]|nr:hypothetical protein [Hymenobacter sp. YIM 151858-1]UYZ60111.1 hypothetical protein OIS50_04745 [Hymenobacter sp. YIM 151858-1]